MTARISIIALALVITLCAASVCGAQTEPEVALLKGDLYSLRSGNEHTVFLVTPDGIVLVDPISIATTRWLKAEFERRFPQQPVKYVIYTSRRVERAEGAGFFKDAADIIATREFTDALAKARNSKDEKRYRRVMDAESRFDDTHAITIGGAAIDLIHVPTLLSPEAALVVFRRERVAFIADAPLTGASPFTFGTFKPRDVRHWLAAVTSRDFDVLLLGDGSSIEKSQLVKLSAYVDEIVTTVAAQYEAGRSPSEFTQTRLSPAHRSDPAFVGWRSNVSDAYRDVSVVTLDATIGAMGSYIKSDDVFCKSFTTCSSGGIVPAGTASVSASVGRWSVVGEMTAIKEAFSSRSSRFYDEDFAIRETRGAVLIRRTFPAGGSAFRLLGGWSYAVADRRGVARIKEGLAPFAGRHPIESNDNRWSFSGGADLVIGRRLGIVVPLRINYATEDAKTTWPSRFDAQAGIGMTLRLFRTID
jgi:hypothetical protein